MIDARPTLVSIFLKFANEVDTDHLEGYSGCVLGHFREAI